MGGENVDHKGDNSYFNSEELRTAGGRAKGKPVSFYPIEAVVPIATVLRPLVGVLSAALAVKFFLISSATSRDPVP
ncbi:hypothetical protein L1987_06719 [Smallanthus sonchifolius]|uniref:Uncharacterized protein n=1 Tax=Smallanthus sonchifolius TaxID=185202 RepID=A0ACB9JYX4_9ASTR|nr:hypothetical protein L1987_06719 [Smallanthus sonchifolius]